MSVLPTSTAPPSGSATSSRCGDRSRADWPTVPPLEETACPSCGARERRQRFNAPPYGVWICSQCDLTYVSPRIASHALIRDVYGPSYWQSPAPRLRGYSDYAADEEWVTRSFERRLRGLEALLPKEGRVLDVGCAAGSFLRIMQSRGWEVMGLEPSLSMCTRAQATLSNDRILLGGLERLSSNARFDLITLWDVIEHLPAPHQAIAQAVQHLSPRGQLLVLTQNVNSPMARLLGRRWQHYKHAEHLTHFHRGTLRSALEGAGLRVEHMGARHAGKFVSLEFAIERIGRLSMALSSLLQPLLKLGNPRAYINPYDELVAIARRR